MRRRATSTRSGRAGGSRRGESPRLDGMPWTGGGAAPRMLLELASGVCDCEALCAGRPLQKHVHRGRVAGHEGPVLGRRLGAGEQADECVSAERDGGERLAGRGATYEDGLTVADAHVNDDSGTSLDVEGELEASSARPGWVDRLGHGEE